MSGGLVSLVMPVWQPNREWLEQAVDAALHQRGCEIELVVVDDGAPEPIDHLFSSFEDPRVRLIRSDHGGPSAARNVGIREARGAYIRFIDADDVIAPESTAELLGLTHGGDDVIAYGATVFCDEDLNPIWKMTSKIEGNGVRACLLGRFTARPHAFVLPRRVVEATGEWDPEIRVNHDWDFILRALEHASLRSTQAIATYYRRHSGGVTSMTTEGLRGPEQVVDAYFERHPEQRGTSLERLARARALAHQGRVYATNRRPGKGIVTLGRAAIMDPRAVWTEVGQAMPVAAARGRRLLHLKPNLPKPPIGAS
jgi:glycosyltransferase involved in cell wall biosynthesis